MKRVAILSLFLFACSFTVFAQSNNTDETLQKANQLFSEYKEPQALEAYLSVLKSEPDNYTALWNASYLYSRIGNRFDEKKQKVEYFKKAKELAERALKVDSTDANSNFAMSVAMGRIALISGAKARLAASSDIKYYAEQALKFDPHHAGAWHVLGRWNYKVANLNFAEKFAAKVLFGGLPKGASDQNAIYDYKKAIDYDGNTLMYYIDLAKVYQTEDQDQEAIKTLQKMLQLQPKTPDDPRFVKEANQMLKKLN